MSKTIEFLKKCSDSYYNSGELYKASVIECDDIEEELDMGIFRNSALIYNDSIEITDAIFDNLYKIAKEVFPDDPYWQEVGSQVSGFGVDLEIPHTAGSLVELDYGDFEKWDFRGESLHVSSKLDGVSCILHFNGGKLVNAISRGNGLVGKDITRHYLAMTNGAIFEIPDKGDIWIRGELIIAKDNFKRIQEQSKYKSARNTASGYINAKESNPLIAKYIQFIPYHIDGMYTLCESDVFGTLIEWGFRIPFTKFFHKDDVRKELNETIMTQMVAELKQTSPWEIDGIVITVSDHQKWNGYETGTINPKYSRKFKKGATDNIAETVVENITWQISKHGKFTPVLNVKPVKIQGVEVSNATANNYEWFRDKRCGKGAKIIISRNGDVIPNVREVLVPSDDLQLPEVKTKVVGKNLVLDGDDESLVDERLTQQMVFFGQSLELDQLGYGNAKLLVKELGLTPVEILGVSKDSLVDVIGKNGEKIYDSIQKVISNLTEVQLASALNAFGVGIGEKILQPVFDTYGTLEITKNQLDALPNFGEKRIEQYLHRIPHWTTYKNVVLEMGIQFKKAPEKESDKFSGLVMGFTGVRDKELMEFINKNGGIAQDSMTSKTTVLVAKDPNANSSKLEKARQKGIEIISLDDARKRYME